MSYETLTRVAAALLKSSPALSVLEERAAYGPIQRASVTRFVEQEYERLRLLALDLINLRDNQENRERKDMALLIARLAHSLEKANPESDLPAKATDYLRRKDLLSPLR